MSRIVVACMTLLGIFIGNANSQENPRREFSIEFTWQKEIAKKQQKDIKDYFLLLPSELIDCEGAQFSFYSTQEKREELIKELDSRNGYLRFGAAAELAVFKDRANKKDIIAIQVGRCGAGRTCGAHNTLMELEGNDWKFRVDLLPNGKTLEQLYFEGLRSDTVCPYFDLPQYGTTIMVRNEWLQDGKTGKIIAKYVWDGHRFAFEE